MGRTGGLLGGMGRLQEARGQRVQGKGVGVFEVGLT